MPAGWDDFRFVKAVAEGGGLAAAASALGIDHSTAFRRLAAIEAGLDAPLFERRRTGYVPTQAGAAMVEAAERIEADVTRFSRALAGQADTLSGELRVTAPAGFASGLMMPILAGFSARHPAIRLDLILAEEALNLSRRDADVALRASRGPDETLVGRRLTGIAWAVYGLAGGTYGDLAREPWIGVAESVAGGLFARFVRARAEPDRVRVRLNAVTGLRAAVAAGLGIAPLPCFEADSDAGLRRLTDPEPDLSADLWILTHPDLRRAARVRAFMDHVAAAIRPLRPAFEGRR
ncbi:LysR substrate-binding domain-containing protein [Methylobacterium sp. NEAU 140]|uniref:LysR family transcriptional regulator n=1 Tax=Methylobacterium sp. NEAU 140 TaxID=3064945 RepID=UPI0027359464|nr:LysR substrate-binding domain-containing protein [Methylobacterium sp. NEAU 140]MDP4024403.1 LysR substrate-binding domain-containing protein [Methylobacterium sp. NEAU 140]